MRSRAQEGEKKNCRREGCKKNTSILTEIRKEERDEHRRRNRSSELERAGGDEGARPSNCPEEKKWRGPSEGQTAPAANDSSDLCWPKNNSVTKKREGEDGAIRTTEKLRRPQTHTSRTELGRNVGLVKECLPQRKKKSAIEKLNRRKRALHEIGSVLNSPSRRYFKAKALLTLIWKRPFLCTDEPQKKHGRSKSGKRGDEAPFTI